MFPHIHKHGSAARQKVLTGNFVFLNRWFMGKEGSFEKWQGEQWQKNHTESKFPEPLNLPLHHCERNSWGRFGKNCWLHRRDRCITIDNIGRGYIMFFEMGTILNIITERGILHPLPTLCHYAQASKIYDVFFKAQ